MSALDLTAADVRALAQQRTRIELSEPVARFDRLWAALVAKPEASKSEASKQKVKKPRRTEQQYAVESDEPRAAAVLQFSQDSQGRARLSGHLRLSVSMACNRCLEAKDVPLEAELKVLLLDDIGFERLLPEEQATLDVAIVDLRAADLLALIEDELLLALPTQVCVQDDCPRRPPMSFAPTASAEAASALSAGESRVDRESGTAVADGQQRQRPFAGLQRLLDQEKMERQKGLRENDAQTTGAPRGDERNSKG